MAKNETKNEEPTTSNQREAVLGLQDCRVERILIPEWPGEWFVRVMGGADRNALQSLMLERRESGQNVPTNLFAELAVRALCDAEGKRIFRDEDAAALGEKNGLILDRIWDAGASLNGLTQDEIEELKKNS